MTNTEIKNTHIRALADSATVDGVVDLEKFAQLIVENCAAGIRACGRLDDTRPQAQIYSRMIRVHYGLE